MLKLRQMGTQEVQGVFLGWFVRLRALVQEILVVPWLLQSAQYKNFFLTVHHFTSSVPIVHSKLGRLSPDMCLWSHLCVVIYVNPRNSVS
jgi:hypothetical protein